MPVSLYAVPQVAVFCGSACPMKISRQFGNALALLLLLSAAWFFWSGIYKPILLWLGALSCVLSLFLAYRIGFFNQHSGLHLIPRIIWYWWWLLKQIARSSYEVSRIVLTPSLPISPTEATLDAEPKGPIGQVVLANSITLSPGTVTLDLYRGKLCVHCLTRSGMSDVQEANRVTARLTGK